MCKDIDKVINNINNTGTNEYKVKKKVLTTCGYEGLWFSSKIPNNIIDPYRTVLELISSSMLIYEAILFDLYNLQVITFYRDYVLENGETVKIQFEKYENFDRYVKYFEEEIGTNRIYVDFSTLEIKSEDLKQISLLKNFMDVIQFIKSLYPTTKPKPNIKNTELTKYELVELINYEKNDFKITEIFEDGFHNGYEIEMSVNENVDKEMEYLLKDNSLIVNATFNINKSVYKLFNSGKSEVLPDFMNKNLLAINESYVVLHVYLDLEDLLDIRIIENSNGLLDYFKSRKSKDKFNEAF